MVLMANLYSNDKLNTSTLLKKALEKGLRVGYLDIETSPYLVWTYPLYKAFIAYRQIEEELKVTSIVYMEEKDLKPHILEWEFKKGKSCDKKILKEISTWLNEMDVVVMQNGDNYDAKILQDRIMCHSLQPIKSLITIDTLKLSRQSFKRSHHSLDARSNRYGYGGKLKQDMSDCIAVAKGDVKCQKSRIKYNIKDVIDMRKVFLKEIDYYHFPQAILNLFRRYLKEDKVFCVKCAAIRKKKFNVKLEMVKLKNKKREKRLVCQNCGYHWKVKRQ